MWDAFSKGQISICTSELTILETLVLPLRIGNIQLKNDYEQFLFRSGLTLLEVTRQVIQQAAQLRASHLSLKTPDSIHVATARLNQTAMLLTNDLNIKSVPGNNVVVLDNLP
jgi:predicted nucleic acid-binding protein